MHLRRGVRGSASLTGTFSRRFLVFLIGSVFSLHLVATSFAKRDEKPQPTLATLRDADYALSAPVDETRSDSRHQLNIPTHSQNGNELLTQETSAAPFAPPRQLEGATQAHVADSDLSKLTVATPPTPFHQFEVTTQTAVEPDESILEDPQSKRVQSTFVSYGVQPMDSAKYHKGMSRFRIPSHLIPRIRTLTLEESGYRILYSSSSQEATDGLGHSASTINAEISTALRIGLTYTHRTASYGVLSYHKPDAVEDFFGWIEGEIPRLALQKYVCVPKPNVFMDRPYGGGHLLGSLYIRVNPHEDDSTPCPTCMGLRESRTEEYGFYGVKQIVPLSGVASFPSDSAELCRKGEGRMACIERVRDETYNLTNTLFAMATKGCNTMRMQTDFRLSAPWFYWKYWDRHAVGGANPSPPRIDFAEDEISIAIHARRGDFLNPVKRRTPTPSNVFVNTTLHVIRRIVAAGGPFAKLPVARVYVYSEGVYRNGTTGGHRLIRMTKDFQDVDGSIQDSTWWENALTVSDSKMKIEVTLRISTDTLLAAHEMASADVFIGSKSGFSTEVVRPISRGVLVLPCPLFSEEEFERASCYDMGSGEVTEAAFDGHWKNYTNEFQEFLPTWR